MQEIVDSIESGKITANKNLKGYFELLANLINETEDVLDLLNEFGEFRLVWHLTDSGRNMRFNFEEGLCNTENPGRKPDVFISSTLEVFVRIIENRVVMSKYYHRGKLKIKGDVCKLFGFYSALGRLIIILDG
jgi:hypothetical protein